MKKIKLIVLIGLLFILSGCKANYSVNITSDGVVTEKFVISVDTKAIASKDPKAFIKDTIKTYKDNRMYIDYNIKTDVSKKNATITATRRYSSMSDYINNSELLPSLFEKTLYIDDYGVYGMQTTGEYYYDAIYDTSIADEPLFDTIDIYIHSHFNFLENDALEFDKKNNTLHYHINEEKKIFSINFKYNNSKKYDIIIKDYLKNNWTGIVALIAIIIAVVIIVRFVKKQDKINNKI